MATINPPHQPLHFPPLPKATGPLWFGVLGAPAAWAVQLQIIYALTHTACHHNSRTMLLAITVILLFTSSSSISNHYRHPSQIETFFNLCFRSHY